MTINLKSISVNKPRANIEDYVFTVYGRPKAGKTTLFAELTKKIYGDVNSSILIAFEPGFKALEVVAQGIDQWKDFVETVNQLVKDKNSLPFKFVGIDTADIMHDLACKYVVNKKKFEDGKDYKVIGDIAYGAGYDLVDREIKENLGRLIKAGYGLMIITHDTDKKFESRDGVSYDKTTCSLPNRARNTILNMSDFILFIDIAKEKDENDKLVDKRYIYFRADGADLEAGSRFKNVPNKIEYDVDQFQKTFEHAVLTSFSDENVDIEKVKKEQQVERKVEVEEFVEEEQAKISTQDLIAAIEVESGKLSANEIKEHLVPTFKELLGTPNFRKVEDVEKLAQALKFTKEKVNGIKGFSE